MNCRWWMGAFALGIGLAGVQSDAQAQIIDLGKYPSIAGGWGRSEVYPMGTRGEASADAGISSRLGGQSRRPGQGRARHRYDVSLLPARDAAGDADVFAHGDRHHAPAPPMLLIDHIHDDRRIFTDGRAWPEGEVELSYNGYSIGKWIDEDGDGKYDVLEVETRYIKGPRTLDGLLPTHADNQTVVKEHIYLDKAKPDILHDEITLIDHAYTRPWTVTKNYPRYKNPGPTGWPEEVCAEAQVWVSLGKEDYFLSSDGYLMPTKKGQAPPDLRYFKPVEK